MVSNELVLEQRLVAVERAISDIQLQLAGSRPSPDWLDAVTGSVTDEAAFREALKFGQDFRSADRPTDDREGQP
jgi:hypothetical protein